MKTSFVIPVYNNYDLLHQLLWDIYKQCCCNNLHEVIVVNDASTEKAIYDGLGWWTSQKMLPIKIMNNEENRGFLLTSNKGLICAEGDNVILVSTDVRIYKNVLSEVTNQLRFYPDSLIGGKVYTHNTGWNTFDGKIFSYVEGWLLATTKDGWEKLGYFDEQYAPNDFEDVDLSTTALSIGMQLYQLTDGTVFHAHPASTIGYGPEREALTNINRGKFYNKWIKE